MPILCLLIHLQHKYFGEVSEYKVCYDHLHQTCTLGNVSNIYNKMHQQQFNTVFRFLLLLHLYGYVHQLQLYVLLDMGNFLGVVTYNNFL